MNRKALSLAGLLVLAAAGSTAQAPDRLFGFSASKSGPQIARETEFRSLLDPKRIRANMELLSAHPHHVGSTADRQNAEWILSRFREWGWDAHLETFEVLYPTPRERLVEMISPVSFRARLEEPAVPEDPTSNQKSEQLPTFNIYSVDGDVTAPLVFVNFGLPSDYEELDRLGISVEGKIVIARYLGSWRGIKPKVAAEHGAIGCLIYSDPREDGYAKGETFPKGPFRPPDGVQRGSVAESTLYSGDPQTPGYGSVPGAKRLPLSEVKTLTKIPVLPLSYADAEPLLRNLDGPMAPEKWRGALAFPYHVGPGPAKVHLKVKFNWDLKEIRDVIAKLPGGDLPDEWVIRGNHFDAWVNGAEDPISGQSAMLEEARVLGELKKKGWTPKRTIIYCAWDGEEPGLLGSTEWAETHAVELSAKAAAYLNSDSNGRGFFSANASPSLERFVDGVVFSLRDPETAMSVERRAKLREIAEAKDDADAQAIRERPYVRARALGSGSDYCAFVDHLGIASMNFAFGGEDDGGIYHSIYDDFYWYTHFSDTEFVYGRALAEASGTAVLRLADAELLPFDFSGLSGAVTRYVDELKTLALEMRSQVLEKNRRLDEGVFAAMRDPRRPTIAPDREEPPPFLSFSPLENAAAALESAAKSYEQAADTWQKSGSVNPEFLRKINGRLIESERALLTEQGLPGRPWYRHQISAPGAYTGYEAKTLPAVREPIEQKKWTLAEEEIGKLAQTLEGEAHLISKAAALLSAGAK
jgi:N-acetylated-alpha-linked acidic dipeptidase